MNLPKWGRALAAYQLAGVPAMLANLTLVTAALGLIAWLCIAGMDRLFGGGSTISLVVVPILFIAAACLSVLVVPWLAVRFDPMGWLKRLGADRLNALADRLAEQMPPPADATRTPPTDQIGDE